MNRQFEAQLNEAIRLKQSKDFHQAWELFKQLSKENPRSAYFWSNYAHLAFLMNRSKDARRFAESALSLDPGSRFSRSLYASILLRSKEVVQALDLIKELIEEKLEIPLLRKLVKVSESLNLLSELDPYFNDWMIHYSEDSGFVGVAAEYYQKAGKTERAIELYEQIVNQDKTNKFAYERMIDLKTRGKSGPEKIHQLEMILKLPSQGKNVHLLGLLAREYKKVEDWGKAEQVYRKILALEPGNLFEKKQMGFLYSRQKNWAGTVELLTECLMKDPDDHFVRSSLFSAFKNSGGKSEALKFIDQLLLQYPEKRNYLGIRKQVEKWQQEVRDSKSEI